VCTEAANPCWCRHLDMSHVITSHLMSAPIFVRGSWAKKIKIGARGIITGDANRLRFALKEP